MPRLLCVLLALGTVGFAPPLSAGELFLPGHGAEQAHHAEDALRAVHFFDGERGLHTAPNHRRSYDFLRTLPGNPYDALRRRMGFIADGDDALGLFWIDRSADVRIAVAGCAACHAGRAAGRTIIGLGNKTIDVGETGRVILAEALLTRSPLLHPHRDLNDAAAELGRRLSDERWSNLTRGLVSTALVMRWFYEQSGERFPDDFPRGCVKVPAVWGYGEKQQVGLFADGSADGASLAWSGLIELTSGQSFESFRKHRERLASLKERFGRLLPPPYPFAVDERQARLGREIFVANCARCHGEYRRDPSGRPLFEPPRFVAWDEVGTDPDRLKYRDTGVFQLIDRAAWREEFVYHRREPGYLAPRLEGIWARFPYLHNGSVPTLAALLTPAARRPRYWSVEDAGEADRFDAATVGLTMPESGSAADLKLRRHGLEGSREVYFVDRPGHSNQGHEFGVDRSNDEKAALLEYLKTL